MIYKSQIKRITEAEASEMFALLTDSDSPGENMPEGLFLWQEAGWWVACDNLDGYAWVEQFRRQYDAEHWLLGW